MMSTSKYRIDVGRYAKCIEVSKRVRWDIESDDHQVMEAI